MRDLNPLYAAVLQAVEAMTPNAQTPQPELEPQPRAPLPKKRTTAHTHLTRLLNGDFQQADDVTAPQPIALQVANAPQ